MEVIVTEAAWADMLAIAGTIASENPGRAETFVEDLYHRCVGIGHTPRAYPLVPDHEFIASPASDLWQLPYIFSDRGGSGRNPAHHPRSARL